jgi:hypothetical protein
MATTPVRLLDIRVYQQTSDEQIVGWSPAGGDLDQVAVQVYARYAETADDEKLVLTTTASARFARVNNVRLRDQFRVVIYRLFVTDGNGATREYNNIRLDGDREIGPVKNLRLSVRAELRRGGDPVLVYQRVSANGVRCSCYDKVLKKLTRANCELCFNTGWLVGYYPPVLTLAQISPEIHNAVPGDHERQELTSNMLLAEYPQVRPRDMIYELDTGRRYRVGSVLPTMFNRQLIHQTFPAIRLNPGDVEHNVPVPDPDTLEPVMTRVHAPRGRRNVVVANPGEDIQIAQKKI